MHSTLTVLWFWPTLYFAVASVIFVMLQLVIWAQLHSHKSDHWKLCLLSQACAQTVFLSLHSKSPSSTSSSSSYSASHCSFLWLAWELQPSLYAVTLKACSDLVMLPISNKIIKMYALVCNVISHKSAKKKSIKKKTLLLPNKHRIILQRVLSCPVF